MIFLRSQSSNLKTDFLLKEMFDTLFHKVADNQEEAPEVHQKSVLLFKALKIFKKLITYKSMNIFHLCRS